MAEIRDRNIKSQKSHEFSQQLDKAPPAAISRINIYQLRCFCRSYAGASIRDATHGVKIA
jgi:hypothetical protein